MPTVKYLAPLALAGAAALSACAQQEEEAVYSSPEEAFCVQSGGQYVLRSGKIFVEYEPQTRIEGDIQQLDADHPVHDLWRVIAEESVGRESNEQVTIFDSVGFALEDFSALRYLHALAIELDEGVDVNLIPTLDDPKDLFEKVLDGQGRTHTRKAA